VLLRRDTGAIQHAAGSCRTAGFNDANGVVNPDGAVKGIAALRVADASIMPSDCRANTHFTTVVIGEAIARMMIRKADVSNNAAAMALRIGSRWTSGRVRCWPRPFQRWTATAAAVIKRPDLGMIAPGATADLAVVDMTHPHLQPLFDPRRGLGALGNHANIDQVIVDGRVLIDAGRYVHGDETAMMSAANAAIGKIWDLPEAQAAFNG